VPMGADMFLDSPQIIGRCTDGLRRFQHVRIILGAASSNKRCSISSTEPLA
jgi:hypothetical protein